MAWPIEGVTMEEMFSIFLGLAKNTSIVDIALLVLLCIIKYNDIRHLELRNRIEDSKAVKRGDMTKQEYMYAHNGKEPINLETT
jgi:hypothetical protein